MNKNRLLFCLEEFLLLFVQLIESFAIFNYNSLTIMVILLASLKYPKVL